MIKREEYLKMLISSREKEFIKVLTGVRRCGKSTLFSLYIDYLKSTGVEESQIISINLEDLKFEDLIDYKALYTYVNSRLCEDKFTYVFIDEVQVCEKFEKAVDSLFIKPNVDVYITGSNAFMLSGELATLLSGRYIIIDMLPFSFAEYLESSKDKEKSNQQKFSNYIKYGSFPYISLIEGEEPLINLYIEGIYTTILVKDIANRKGITDIVLLESIISIMARNIGVSISINRIAEILIEKGRQVSVNTVDLYIKTLVDSYIFYKVDRYDINKQQYLKTLGKFYMVDSGIRNLRIPDSTLALASIIENIVYLELLRRGNRVSIGKIDEKEVDFIAVKQDHIIYYQVATSVLDLNVLQQELEPFYKISDSHPKVLLSLDEIGAGNNYGGIRQFNVIEWLLDKE